MRVIKVYPDLFCDVFEYSIVFVVILVVDIGAAVARLPAGRRDGLIGRLSPALAGP